MKKFDPFKNRRARIIRNTLSKSFLESLAQKDASGFQERAALYLQQDLDQVHRDYIAQRLLLYKEAFGRIKKNRIEAELGQAIVLWERQLYYEMHELLENIWINTTGTERKALQGLIQAAGMKIHAEHGNMKAACSMGRKAQQTLQLYQGALQRSEQLGSIMKELKEALSKMR